jgi:hypothetical protein
MSHRCGGMTAPTAKRTVDESARRIRVFRSLTSFLAPLVCAVLGGAIGALVGELAELPGVIVGAFLGAAIGAMAGRAIDVQRARSSKREAYLDDEIGVTSGSLGRGPSVSPGALPAIERGEVDAEDLGSPFLVAPGLGEDPVGVGAAQPAKGPATAVARRRP